ncbi:hypothetical protein EAG_14280 [Camponotus floridanus]|uniref:Uncharacterized protein n=1 Tax=Camponotus floridanus TaxID=104421 RepID=E2A4F0_CAMFO|nr:hypothetical protein EAG_14280 [Camponotus floridanus]
MRLLSSLGEVASKVVLRILWRHTLGERETQGSRGTSHVRSLCRIDSLGTQKIALVILGTWGNPHPVYVWRVHYVCCLCSARNETTIRPVFRDVPDPPLTEETRDYWNILKVFKVSLLRDRRVSVSAVGVLRKDPGSFCAQYTDKPVAGCVKRTQYDRPLQSHAGCSVVYANKRTLISELIIYIVGFFVSEHEKQRLTLLNRVATLSEARRTRHVYIALSINLSGMHPLRCSCCCRITQHRQSTRADLCPDRAGGKGNRFVITYLIAYLRDKFLRDTPFLPIPQSLRHTPLTKDGDSRKEEKGRFARVHRVTECLKFGNIREIILPDFLILMEHLLGSGENHSEGDTISIGSSRTSALTRSVMITKRKRKSQVGAARLDTEICFLEKEREKKTDYTRRSRMEPGANAQSISRRRLEVIVSVGALRASAATDRSTAALPFRHKFHLGEIRLRKS